MNLNSAPVSKGKWLPGSLKSLRESHGLGYHFYCEVCDRGFPTQSSFEKHNQTEMHFKRMTKSFGKDSNLNSLFDQFDYDRLPNQRARRNIEVKNYCLMDKKKPNDQLQDRTRARCPTCFALFSSNMMGKHLLSYFHCQKSERADRMSEPEKSLILNNIHSIVTLSPYQCKPCRFYFTKRSQLLKHFEETHQNITVETVKKNVSEVWVCSACTAAPMGPASMLAHLQNSTEHEKMEAAIQKSIPIVIKNVRLRTCRYCFKSFLLRRELLSHELNCPGRKSAKGCLSSKPVIHKKIPEEQLVGTREGGVGNSNGEIQLLPAVRIRRSKRLGEDSNQSAKDFKFQCSRCEFSARSEAHLARHSKVHQKQREKNFVCEICAARFYEKFQLNFHLKIHGNKEVKCNFPDCDYHGRSLSEIKSHAVIHSKSELFRCRHCEYITYSRSHFRRHSKLVHHIDGQPKQFLCKSCPFMTNFYHGLKRHQLTHESAKSFKCPHCDYTAKNIEALRTHVLKRKLHADAYLYNCLLCSFSSSVTPAEEIFRTNKFSDFKTHIQRKHSTDALNSDDQGIYALAGLRKDLNFAGSSRDDSS